MNPIIDESELKALHEEVETDQKEWEQDVLARIRVEEEDRMDEDVLFYEVVKWGIRLCLVVTLSHVPNRLFQISQASAP